MTQIPRIKGAFLAGKPNVVNRVWGPRQQERLARLVELPPEILTPENIADHVEWLAETRVIFSHGRCLASRPSRWPFCRTCRRSSMQAGTVKGFADPLFDHKVTVVSAWAANAVPVAEYTLSQILFGLKLGWQHHRQFREANRVRKAGSSFPFPVSMVRPWAWCPSA